MHKCAKVFGLEITDLLEGQSAKLSGYTVTRRGKGLVTASEDGITIQDMAPMFRKKLATPYWVTYEYDEKGRPILQKDSGGTVSLEYNEQDQIVKRVRAAWGQNDTTLYAYDEQGNLIEEIYKPADTSFWDKYTWEYDEYGDVTKCTVQTFSQEGDSQTIIDTVVHTYANKEYDENGNLAKVVYKDGSYTAYEYDEAGNKIKYTSYHAANDFVIFYYTYDENGNMLVHIL